MPDRYFKILVCFLYEKYELMKCIPSHNLCVCVTKDAHGAVYREILQKATFAEMKGLYGWGKN